MELPSVATYLTTGVLAKRKHMGVATNVYLRKTLEKTKKWSANFKNKSSGVVYA